jgi:predicted kinase
MPKVIICRGLQASGKTTFAKDLVKKGGWTRVNKDDLRAMLHGGSYSGSKEKQVLKVRDSIIIQALRKGDNVVVDDTNFEMKHIERIAEVVEAQANIDNKEYTWEVKDFDIGLYDAIYRDTNRERSVGEKVIRSYWNKYIRPGKREVVTPVEAEEMNLRNEKLAEGVTIMEGPDAVLFDIDGTLALMNGRNPYDASTCEYDLLNKPVFDALRRYQKDGYKIIIFSGRKDIYLEQTNNWFKKHGITCDLFAMRKDGDDREDSIIKHELFMNHVLGKYNVEVVYDDRMRVVDMWRDMGLTVFQVNEGNF